MGKLFDLKTYNEKKQIVRDKMIKYFDDLNYGKVSIPSFMEVDNLLKQKSRKQIIGLYRKAI